MLSVPFFTTMYQTVKSLHFMPKNCDFADITTEPVIGIGSVYLIPSTAGSAYGSRV